jgi:hypothetical protein
MGGECFDKEGQRTNTPPSKQEFEGKRKKERKESVGNMDGVKKIK